MGGDGREAKRGARKESATRGGDFQGRRVSVGVAPCTSRWIIHTSVPCHAAGPHAEGMEGGREAGGRARAGFGAPRVGGSIRKEWRIRIVSDDDGFPCIRTCRLQLAIATGADWILTAECVLCSAR